LFEAASRNDVVTLKSPLDGKQASAIDVQHGTGHSALHVATMMSKVDAIRTLLQYEAEPLMENGTQETPYDMVWSTVLCFEDTPRSVEWCVADVKKLFPSTAALEERRIFSRIHQIVCKLLPLYLEIEIKKAPHRIDEPDTDGRTALHWAAARGDEKSVELLLRYGANPNTPDRIVQGPLRSSLKATEPGVLKLLIEYGANLMQVDHWEQTCLQAAMYYTDPVAFGAPLIMGGIDVNAQDFRGNTALLEAVRMGHADAVDLLVDNGADVNIQDQSGINAFMEAVARNKNAMATKLLQSRFIDTATLDSRKQSILHYAAADAGTSMLQLLSTFNIEGVDVNGKRDDGQTPLDVAEARQENLQESSKTNKLDEAWIKAFSTLLENVVEAAQGPPPPYKDEEDRFTNYSFTNSPGSSVYFDAKVHLPRNIYTKGAPSLAASSTHSPVASRPTSRPGSPKGYTPFQILKKVHQVLQLL
jgi:ankyrin repeat protein